MPKRKLLAEQIFGARAGNALPSTPDQEELKRKLHAKKENVRAQRS